jgi:hypothetical protein
LVEKESGTVFDDTSMTFKDLNLKDGSHLIMKEPGKEIKESPKRGAESSDE